MLVTRQDTDLELQAHNLEPGPIMGMNAQSAYGIFLTVRTEGV
jgi:hypothetical protein